MPKLLPGALLGLSVLAMAATSAEAGPRRHLNFFEQLFGIRPQNYQPEPPPPKNVWWERKPSHSLYGDAPKKKRPVVVAVAKPLKDLSEPEPLPGLGMGIVNYVPPLALAVFDPSFISLQTQTPETEAIRVTLADKATPLKAVETERKAVLAFYKTNGFKPVWMADGHLTPRANEVLKTLSSAADDGLIAKNYMPEVLSSFDTPEQQVAGDAMKLARLDIGLTLAAVHYARQISGGQFEPNRLSLYNDIRPDTVNAEAALKVLAFSPFPSSYLAGLAPQNPQYAILKTALAKTTGDGPKLDLILDGPKVKPGKSDVRIPAIRARLQTLGFMTAEASDTTTENKLDQDLAIALMAFQTSKKMKPTGAIDSATIRAFNKDDTAGQHNKLVYNLERLRWLPKNLGARHVIVNQAAFEANVIDNGKSTWKTHVIVGRPMTQTYSFSDQIESVVFNPKWGVPASIIINEYAPKMRKDPNYLDRNGFIVVDLKGNEIDSKSVDWWNIGQYPTFGIQQPPGNDNALGELKFLFPNAHDIYMHDTPTKNLFADNVRAYSHGCVRVQNPREFAQVLLGWDKEKVAQNVEVKKPRKGKVAAEVLESSSVPLLTKVPVHLTYFTAWADEAGHIQYFDDIYGRDIAMAKAFAYNPNAKKPIISNDVAAKASIDGGIIQN
jgi:L,D-transpeptidase YcbB